MVKRIMWLVCCLAMAVPLFAQNGEAFRQKFGEMVLNAKSESTPQAKRERLDQVFNRTSEALTAVSQSPLASDREKTSLEAFRKAVEAKRDELHGLNGYARVADQDLNAFAEYTVQDFEQAGEWVYISTLGLVLIVLIIILLVR